MMRLMPQLTRRAALRLGADALAGTAGTRALSALLDPAEAGTSPAPFEPAAATASPTMLTGSFVSAARGGMTTNWVIALPPGQTAASRPVIALHGKGGNADTVIDLGVEDGLAGLVKAGRPPWTAGPATLSTGGPTIRGPLADTAVRRVLARRA
jgi:hypothetical protein